MVSAGARLWSRFVEAGFCDTDCRPHGRGRPAGGAQKIKNPNRAPAPGFDSGILESKGSAQAKAGKKSDLYSLVGHQ
jgi:hypothetical protein